MEGQKIINAKTYSADIWVSRISNIITIFVFIFQIPTVNKIFISQFIDTSIAFKLMISTFLVFTCSYSLNNFSFKKGKVFISVLSSIFLINFSAMFMEGFFINTKIDLIVYVIYFFSDWLGLKASELDFGEIDYFDQIQATKIVLYLAYLILLSKV